MPRYARRNMVNRMSCDIRKQKKKNPLNSVSYGGKSLPNENCTYFLVPLHDFILSWRAL